MTGYITTGIGDSGGPFWTYDTILENDRRAVLIAVQSSGDNFVNLRSAKDQQCRITATKITDDILAWIKYKSGIKDIQWYNQWIKDNTVKKDGANI